MQQGAKWGRGGSTSGWDGVRWRQRTAPAFRPRCVVFWVAFCFFSFFFSLLQLFLEWVRSLVDPAWSMQLLRASTGAVSANSGGSSQRRLRRVQQGLVYFWALMPPLAQGSVGTTDNLWGSPAHPREAPGFLV